MSQILFIPGLLCTGDIFEKQIAHFQGQAECHVADTTGMNSITAMAEKALAQMSGPFAVLGFSMGGYVALEIARLASKRITGLALVSTSARPDTEEKKKARSELVKLSKIGRFKGVTPRLLPRFFSEENLQNTEMTEVVLGMGATIGQENFMYQQEAIMGRRDQRPHLADITQPSVVICGMQDVLTPPNESEEMAASLPNNELCLLENIAHMSTLEAPHLVNQALHRWHQRILSGAPSSDI